MFPFVCDIWNAISYATYIRPRRQVSFPSRRQAKISVNSSRIAHLLFAVTPSNVFASCYDIAWLGSRSNSNIRNSAWVDGLYECISSRGWDIEHCSIPPPLLGAPANGNRKSISLSESEHQPSARGTNSPVFRIQDTFRTVIWLRYFLICAWVVTSIVIEVFPSIVISDRWRPTTGSSCCQICKLVSSRSRTAAMIAVGPNRKPPSPIKYDGLTRTVLEKVFRSVY